MLPWGHGSEESGSQAAVGVSTECFRGDAGRSLVFINYRDMMIRGFQTYKEFLASDERIATNILADRLRKLEAHDIITTQPDAADGRKLTYLLTPKGIDLAPVLAEMVLWAARHEETGNQPLVRALQTNKQGVVTEVRDRWAQKRIHRAG
jgi:DNA-binding HxlR family transcriptional regulator